MEKNVKHIDRKTYFLKTLRTSPLELVSIFSTAFKTFQYRYICRCIGKETIVGKGTEIKNYSNVRIGSHCLVQDRVYFRAGLNGIIKVGDYCAINSFAKLFGHGGVEIGDYSQIGPGSLITTTVHNYKKSMEADFLKVKVGNWVWIGACSIVLAGITIGDRSVIGAGSVVNKNIPPDSVAVGNPAKIIKKRDVKNAE
jgi:acetyltransferase-like isoleucine patch superfamily enzyme